MESKSHHFHLAHLDQGLGISEYDLEHTTDINLANHAITAGTLTSTKTEEINGKENIVTSTKTEAINVTSTKTEKINEKDNIVT